jgi:hypothetical protein
LSVATWLAYKGSLGLDQDAACGKLRRRLIEAFAVAWKGSPVLNHERFLFLG